MKKKLLLLTLAVLIASPVTFACVGKMETVKATTATWLPGEKAVQVKDVQGVSITIKGLEPTDFQALADKGEVKIEVTLKPKPGDAVEIVLNRKCQAEELIILAQFVELHDYISNVRELETSVVDMIIEAEKRLGFTLLVPLKEYFRNKYLSHGLAWGILKTDVEKLESLPFVEGVQGCKASSEAIEVIGMPFKLAHQVQVQEKNVISLGGSEFQVLPLQIQGP